MRIISQDGTIDIPYEQVIIERYKGKINFFNKNLTGVANYMKIASYSTEEKAQKAIDMMHEAYKSSLYSDHAYDSSAQLQRPYLFMQNIVFKMPQDDEVEKWN